MSHKITKVKKKFDYQGIELRIVEREEKEFTPKGELFRTYSATRVVNPNGNIVPYNIRHKETLKDIESNVKEMLDEFSKRGADVKNELKK